MPGNLYQGLTVMNKFTAAFSALCLLAVSSAALAAEAPGDYKLDPKDEALLAENCTKCHDSGKYRGRVYSVEEWNAVLKLMQERGAKFNIDDMKAVKWYKPPSK